jgi:hypothetical protein
LTLNRTSEILPSGNLQLSKLRTSRLETFSPFRVFVIFLGLTHSPNSSIGTGITDGPQNQCHAPVQSASTPSETTWTGLCWQGNHSGT